MQTFRRRALSLTTAFLAAASLAACTPGYDAQVPAAAGAAEAGTALEQLATIPVKGRAPKTGYSREQFGEGWLDPDHNGCDARNDVLARDLANETFKPGTKDCVVLTGTLADPYTGKTIDFVRGNKTSTLVQIDHVVALSDAWQKGARKLSSGQREAFANDPLNLRAADGPTNGAKGDGDAATWLPPNKGFRCEYVALQTAVKAKYGLWMTRAEYDAIKKVLTSSCADQRVPADGGGVTLPAIEYKNCAEVKARGAAPIRVGDPGWSTKFDGNGDGVGCEG
ncbi:DUF1524 domain-containing protein [Arthrobacter sp. Marseille-P9274]|uniref:GmrSD restriction endonuclease domain-containing protein n=1 Tax=Arthrobacter sp. Marseille-P9274 TaxID=2866572 RepID=UPI0021C8DA40|nr:DUF1524 domain-containing protein [Arthrobacter sp. Marseille-P9274]